MKKTSLVSIFLILLALIAVPMVLAGNPGFDPGTERISGPAIVGTLTITPFDPSYPNLGVNYSFAGNCKGTSIPWFGYFSVDYSLITEAYLENSRLGAVPAVFEQNGCVPSNAVPTDIMINTVVSFADNTAQSIKTADVILLFVVVK